MEGRYKSEIRREIKPYKYLIFKERERVLSSGMY